MEAFSSYASVILLLAQCSSTIAGWPRATAVKAVDSTITIKANQVFDGKFVRYVAGPKISDGNKVYGGTPIFTLENGVTIKNVIIGAPVADGIRCLGSCNFENVWWEALGERGAGLNGGESERYNVNGGGARNVHNKVFVMGSGGTFIIKNFEVENLQQESKSGQLIVACGNCPKQYSRHIRMENVTITGPALDFASVNWNYGDFAIFQNIKIVKNQYGRVSYVCRTCAATTVRGGACEPRDSFRPDQDGDGKTCIYKKGDIQIV